MRAAIKSALPPLLLAAVGVYLLIGCIPIPGNYKPKDGRSRPEENIGPAGSGARIELDQTTLNRALLYLGPPDQVGVDGRVAVFNYQVVPGRLFWPLCPTMPYISEPNLAQRYLVLRLHSDGRVQSFKVYKHPREFPDDIGSLRPYAKTLP